MSDYFIETSAIIDYLRGKEKAVFLIDGLEGEFSSSYLCLAELSEGLSRIENSRREENAVQDFFSGLNAVYGVDESIAREFGRLRAGLKKQGKIIEDIDLFIAATCLAYKLILVTANPKHFSRVPGLDILPSSK